ncbi:MAG: acyl-CoA dehydrogenase family protein [Egibacteraceae bacterium]
MAQISTEERAIVDVVADFVDRQVRPVARDLERADTYPEALIEQLQRLGVFGLLIGEPYGSLGVSLACFAKVTEELARGWMSLAGVMGGHSVVASLLLRFGTQAQRARYLPRMATGELRATMALTEPGGGSDLQAMTTTAVSTDDRYVVDGSKMWITSAERAGLVAVLLKTDPDAVPAHRGMSILLAEKGPGLVVSRPLGKLGYKGVETCELSFDGYEARGDALLGGGEGEGFVQMMAGLEVGRIQVAARAVGVARAAFDDALAYAQQRESFGKPIWRHQSIGNYLANMATKIEASRALVARAAERADSGERADLEAGMAKLFASEACMQVTLDAMRIHGGYGYSTEFDIERYFRDAPLMIIGEGTNEIQRNVIVREIVRRGGLPT